MSEFWTLTPHDVEIAVRGNGKTLEHYQSLAAWHLCHILNMFLAKGAQPITVDTLMGHTRQLTSIDEWKAIKTEKLREFLGMSDD